jgi:hypothetical protein
VTFYSTDPAHTGTVTTRAAGPFIEIDHPDGTVTAMGTALKFLDLWGLVSGFPGSGHGLAACWSRRRDGIRCP